MPFEVSNGSQVMTIRPMTTFSIRRNGRVMAQLAINEAFPDKVNVTSNNGLEIILDDGRRTTGSATIEAQSFRIADEKADSGVIVTYIPSVQEDILQ